MLWLLIVAELLLENSQPTLKSIDVGERLFNCRKSRVEGLDRCARRRIRSDGAEAFEDLSFNTVETLLERRELRVEGTLCDNELAGVGDWVVEIYTERSAGRGLDRGAQRFQRDGPAGRSVPDSGIRGFK